MQRHTKIIATLGPAVASAARIQALVEAGIDVARLNFSHGDRELHRTMAGWVRDASRETGRTVALMQDIQGPKLRVGEFANGRVILEPGRHVTLVANVVERTNVWMAEPRDDPRLGQSSLRCAVGYRRSGRQHLERNVSLKPHVPSVVDLSHPSPATKLNDHVGAEACAAREHCA